MESLSLYSGRDHYGDVHERDDGMFEAVVGDKTIGPFETRKAAVDTVWNSRPRPATVLRSRRLQVVR